MNNKIFEVENIYRYYLFRIDNSVELKDKINFFYEFDKLSKEIFKFQFDELYAFTWYLDLYILNIINEYELNKNENNLNEQIEFASDKALISQNSQYYLSGIKYVKELFNIQNSETAGLINEENDFNKNLSDKSRLWDELPDLVFEKENYKEALKLINEYELINGPLKYPDDVVLIDYKWMSLHFDNSQSEAITFISEKIKDYTTKLSITRH